MIVILGANGFVGSEFVRQCRAHQVAFTSVNRNAIDYYDPIRLAAHLRLLRARFLINCAGYTGKPNVDACESNKAECYLANAVLPGLVAKACEAVSIPWGHVSSGCIYSGTREDGNGFTEVDRPNFTFNHNTCSFYSGTKALGEECLENSERCYVWRMRIPFSHVDSERNYISKLLRYDQLLDARNSLSNLHHFVTACLDCWRQSLEFGKYNFTNSGSITTRQVVDIIRRHHITDREFRFFHDEAEFMQVAAIAPRSNAILDNSKGLRAGLHLPPIEQSIEESIQNWTSSFTIAR